jgi:hypothetical protein
MIHNALATKQHATSGSLSTAEARYLTANRTNQELASEVLELARRLQHSDTEDVEDEQVLGQLRAAEEELRYARRNYRLMKSSLSSIIVGSGVDWAGDRKLLELVLDEEDDRAT